MAILAPIRPGAAALSLLVGSPTCHTGCDNVWDGTRASLHQYFYFSEDPIQDPPWTPCVIDTREISDFSAWEARIRKFQNGNRARSKQRAIRLGYYCKIFDWRLHIPDVYEINTSKEKRSGGVMRGGYLRNIEELGGAPTRRWVAEAPACKYHWSITFGVFVKEPSHRQGEIVVDERLVGYISLNRIGEVVLYSMILGHGDHLKNGVMVLLHHDVVRWISDDVDGLCSGLRYIMYGAVDSGGPGLMQWKKFAGFRGQRIDAFAGPLPAAAAAIRAEPFDIVVPSR